MKRYCKMLVCLLLCMTFASLAAAEGLSTLPQIDNSTARIPITDAIYAHFTEQGATGPAPICSKTHGAWLNLADGKADIIFLVAPTEEEMQYFADAGVDIEMKIYGYDGLVFMGNASNPTKNLTSSEIRSIYRGDITDWGAVQDSSVSGDIAVYIRNSESGSQRLFEKLVWKGYEMPDFQSMGFQEGEVQGTEPYKMEEISDMSTITTTVMQNRFSIGYNIMSYVDNVFLSDEVETAKVVTTGSVNLREWASLDAGIVAALPAGTELVLIWQGAHAHAGKIFHQETYQNYFGAQEWYDGKLSYYAQSTAAMDGILLENYTLISQYLSDLRRGIVAVMPRTFAYSVYEDNMTGEDVLELQDALIALHYLAQEYRTGEYDEETRDAVAVFQTDCGLEATGVFDETTRDMLF